jgi:phosphoglycolate phosphatase-like HAD superfamily hydrolase
MVQNHDLILFDLDGTISDPLEGIGRSINYALVHVGYEPLHLPEVAKYIGPPLDETFKEITGNEAEVKALSGEIGVNKSQQIKSLLLQGKVSKSTVMIGDRAVDMVAAHKNGLNAGGVLWGYGSQVELLQEKPRYLFGSPSELRQLADQG